jgi:hypothetical protein
MTVSKGTICDLAGRPLVKNAHIEIEEEPGVSVWGGSFRLPQPSPPMDQFRPQCLVKLNDGRQGKVTIGRCDRTTAYFLGKGKLEAPSAGSATSAAQDAATPVPAPAPDPAASKPAA